MKNMKKILIITLVIAWLFIPIFSAIGTNQQHEINNIKTNVDEDLISLNIYKAPFSAGVNFDITNNGGEIIEDIEWSFRSKAAIFGTGFLIKDKIRYGTIDEIQPGETITIKFRPFKTSSSSPIGFGNLYLNASIKSSDYSYRTQQRARLILFLIVNFKDTYMDIPPSEAYSMYQNGTFDLIIDVVGLGIYNSGHLPGAVNYVWADGTLNEMIPTLDENLTYLVYCHTDPPSTASAQALVNAGIMNTYRLEGNYRAWVNEGYPTETS
jgi:rhodanese-related sulfurtransferase